MRARVSHFTLWVMTTACIAAWLGGCNGATRAELLSGKACGPAGECLYGWVCDAASFLCVPVAESPAAIWCAAPEDCPGTENACETRSCDGGLCAVRFSLPGTPCSFDGGTRCDDDGRCVPCALSTGCPDGHACISATECENGFCVDGVCCDTACGGFCEACTAAKTDRVDGLCTPVRAGSDPDGECPAGTFCDGDAACAPKPNGAACSASVECQTGYCVDDVCCSTACTGTCIACREALSGLASGICGGIPIGTDPEGECGAMHACTGLGQCKQMDGTSCNNDNQCLSNDCCNSQCAAGLDNTCLPVGCSNTLADGSETDVDCGGAVCSKCGSGKACVGNADCIADSCQGGLCA